MQIEFFFELEHLLLQHCGDRHAFVAAFQPVQVFFFAGGVDFLLAGGAFRVAQLAQYLAGGFFEFRRFDEGGNINGDEEMAQMIRPFGTVGIESQQAFQERALLQRGGQDFDYRGVTVTFVASAVFADAAQRSQRGGPLTRSSSI